MKKKFILLIIGLFLLLSTTSVKAESKICEYKDDNINVKVTIENKNISYSFFEYKTDGAVVEEKASESVVDIRDFEPDCASEIYYKKTDNGNNRIYNFYSSSNYSEYSPLKKVVTNTSTSSDDNKQSNTGTTISTNFFGTLDVVKCGNAEIPAPIPPIVRTIINLIKIATPFVLIIIGMIDMLKAVIANDEKKIKEAQISFTKRLIPATLVFLTVTIIQFLVGIIADDSESITNCINCMISNADSCIKINKPMPTPTPGSKEEDNNKNKNPQYTENNSHTNSINGIKYKLYNQSDPEWGKVKYTALKNQPTISDIGCMITSVAVISSAHDSNITPLTVFKSNYRHAYPHNGINNLGNGSFSCKAVSFSKISQFTDSLQEGNVLVIMVKERSSFTNSQHYMALIDVRNNGKQIFVGNSYNSGTGTYNRNGWFNAGTVLTDVRETYVCTPSEKLYKKFN